MSFNGNEGEPISLKLGGTMTAKYRNNNVGARKGQFVWFEIIKTPS